MRADRLLKILNLLQSHGQMSAKDLAERLEVSERTVHRDMEALSIAGIPVYAERGYKGGWALSEGYRSQLTGMTADEISSLLLLQSSSIARDLGLTANMQTALQKLLSALPPSVRQDANYARERIHVDGAAWHRADTTGEQQRIFSLVQEAVWENRKLLISYRPAESEESKQRLICPLGLVAKQSTWYVVAAVEDQLRTYRISRLQEARITHETFSRPPDFNLASYWEHSTAQFKSNLPVYPATVRVSQARWNRFCQERYVTVTGDQEAGDGWREAEVVFHTLESACELLLGYGKYAQAVQPQELRLAMLEQGQEIVALHSSPLK